MPQSVLDQASTYMRQHTESQNAQQTTHASPGLIPVQQLQMPSDFIVLLPQLFDDVDDLLLPDMACGKRKVEDLRDEVGGCCQR